MVGAYETYKQQWTNSGRKKLVKDASKALKEYHSRFNSVEVMDESDYDVHSPDFHTDEYGRPLQGRNNMSLLYLGPKGPEIPLLNTMMTGLQGMVSRAVRNTQHMMENTDLRKIGADMMHSVGYTAEEQFQSFYFNHHFPPFVDGCSPKLNSTSTSFSLKLINSKGCLLACVTVHCSI